MNPCILIVEDDNRLRKFFTKTLEGEKYRVISAPTAEEAMACLRETRADLVLSDVVLKGKDGMTLCRELRDRPESAHLPIVLMSGRRMEEDDQVQGLGSGADDYLLKPVSGKVLVSENTVGKLRRYKAPAWIPGRNSEGARPLRWTSRRE